MMTTSPSFTSNETSWKMAEPVPSSLLIVRFLTLSNGGGILVG